MKVTQKDDSYIGSPSFVDEGGPKREFFTLALLSMKMAQKDNSYIGSPSFVDEGGPKREFFTLALLSMKVAVTMWIMVWIIHVR